MYKRLENIIEKIQSHEEKRKSINNKIIEQLEQHVFFLKILLDKKLKEYFSNFISNLLKIAKPEEELENSSQTDHLIVDIIKSFTYQIHHEKIITIKLQIPQEFLTQNYPIGKLRALYNEINAFENYANKLTEKEQERIEIMNLLIEENQNITKDQAIKPKFNIFNVYKNRNNEDDKNINRQEIIKRIIKQLQYQSKVWNEILKHKLEDLGDYLKENINEFGPTTERTNKNISNLMLHFSGSYSSVDIGQKTLSELTQEQKKFMLEAMENFRKINTDFIKAEKTTTEIVKQLKIEKDEISKKQNKTI